MKKYFKYFLYFGILCLNLTVNVPKIFAACDGTTRYGWKSGTNCKSVTTSSCTACGGSYECYTTKDGCLGAHPNVYSCSRCSTDYECRKASFKSENSNCSTVDTTPTYTIDNTCISLCDSGKCSSGSCYTCTPNCSCSSTTYFGQTCPNGCGGTCNGAKYYSCSKCSSNNGCEKVDYGSKKSDCSSVDVEYSRYFDCSCTMKYGAGGGTDSRCTATPYYLYSKQNGVYSCGGPFDVTNCNSDSVSGCTGSYNCYSSLQNCQSEHSACNLDPLDGTSSAGVYCTKNSNGWCDPYCAAGYDTDTCATNGTQYTIDWSQSRCFMKDSSCTNVKTCYKCGTCNNSTCPGSKIHEGTCAIDMGMVEDNCVDQNAGLSGCAQYNCCDCTVAPYCTCNPVTASNTCANTTFTQAAEWNQCQERTCNGTKQPDCDNANHCIGVSYTSSNGCGTCTGTKQPDCSDAGSHCPGTYASSNGCGNCTGTKSKLYASCTGGSCGGLSCGQPDGSSCTGGNSCGSTSCGGSCNASCGTLDTGNPTATTVNTPNGTASNPTVYTNVTNIPLTWNKSPDAKADFYNIGVWHDGVTSGIRDLDFNTPDENTITTTSNNLTQGIVYRWGVNVKNNTCATIGVNTTYESGWPSTLGYFMVDTPPQVNSLTITNSSGTTVAAENKIINGVNTNINHICDLNFASNKEVDFLVTVSDSDAGDSISSVLLYLGGWTYGPVTPIDGVAKFVINPTNSPSAGTYSITAQATDIHGVKSELKDFSRSFKFWDCMVSIGGTIFDGTLVGFSGPADPTILNFTNLSFHGAGGRDFVMNVNSPNYSSGNKLVWGYTYRHDFNTGIALSGESIRTRSLLDSTWNYLNAVDSSVANPYDSNPTLIADFSGTLIQDPWYQANGGGVISNTSVNGRVPVTCTNDSNCKISISGLVAAPLISNNGNSSYQNWYYGSTSGLANNNARLADYNTNYDYFYSQYFVKKGVGITFSTDDQNISDIGTTGIYFISGNLTINTDKTLLNPNDFLMIIVKGDIKVGIGASKVDGILVASDIGASGPSDSPLIFNGSLYASNKIDFSRDFNNRLTNNSTPAVVVNYDPKLIFNMPGSIAKVLTNWQWGN